MAVCGMRAHVPSFDTPTRSCGPRMSDLAVSVVSVGAIFCGLRLFVGYDIGLIFVVLPVLALGLLAAVLVDLPAEADRQLH